jgi:Leucine-rich repeat (LRR) protein
MQYDNLIDLPQDILNVIFDHLDLHDLVRLSGTSMFLYMAIKTNVNITKYIPISYIQKFKKKSYLELFNRYHNINHFQNELNVTKAMIYPETYTKLVKTSISEITTIPYGIKYLFNMTHMSLTYCKLSSISDEITKLTKLVYLNLCGNKMTTLPDSIFNLTNLISINISSNYIKTIPIQFTKLTKLHQIDLSYNELISIPLDFKSFVYLENLRLDGNKLLRDIIGNMTLPECINHLSITDIYYNERVPYNIYHSKYLVSV